MPLTNYTLHPMFEYATAQQDILLSVACMSDHVLEGAAAAVLCGMEHSYLNLPQGANLSVRELLSNPVLNSVNQQHRAVQL